MVRGRYQLLTRAMHWTNLHMSRVSAIGTHEAKRGVYKAGPPIYKCGSMVR